MDYSILPRVPCDLIKGLLSIHTMAVLPFREEPADREEQDHDKCPGKATALDLFNFFTADIIKMDVLFTK